jgi:hypothetical protein
VSNAERREQKLKVGTEDVLKQVRDKSNLLTTLVSGSKELENAVRNEDDHVWKAMEWLKKNKDQFKMEVYEPMLLHLRVPDKRNSKYALPLWCAYFESMEACDQEGHCSRYRTHLWTGGRTRPNLNLNLNIS